MNAYRPNDPLVIGAKLWPVYGFNHAGTRREKLAVFFCRSDAETFAMHPAREGFEARNVFVGPSREDRRVAQ